MGPDRDIWDRMGSRHPHCYSQSYQFRIDVSVSNSVDATQVTLLGGQTAYLPDHRSPFHFGEAKVVRSNEDFSARVADAIGQLNNYVSRPLLRGPALHDKAIPLANTVIGGFNSSSDVRWCVCGPSDKREPG
jgi:hypothetical protein